LRDKDKQGHVDLEALEFHLRSSMHSVGSRLLERLINSDGGDYRGTMLRSEKGEVFEFKEYRDKQVLTVVGPVRVQRAYYYDKEDAKGYCPKDVALDIAETSFSPGVRRIMARVGAYRPFGLGQQDIQQMAGIDVDSKAIERVSHQLGEEVEGFYQKEGSQFLSGKVVPLEPVKTMYICMDATGVPVVKAETANRKGKGESGQAKTREAKLGCVFTQTTVDEKGYPRRDEDSTSYVGAIETTEAFGDRMDSEALRRGLERAQRVCAIGDAAPWIWNTVEERFYGAIQIIDLYHARQHYWSVARAVFGTDLKKLNQWTERRRKELNEGKVEDVIKAIKRLTVTTPEQKKIVEGEIAFFEKNKNRMRYADFRKQGLFVGSGVVEAGCRTVIGQRLKQSGMHWTVKGANNIIALRCCILSNRWEDFWEQRVSA